MTKIIGIDSANIVKLKGSAMGGISKANRVPFSAALPETKQSINRIGVWTGNAAQSHNDTLGRIVMPTTQEPTTNLRITEKDAITVNFWVKVGWTSALNSQGRYVGLLGIGSDAKAPGQTSSGYNNTFRVFYDENNNRLYFGWLNQTSGSNKYAQAFWPFHVRPNTGLGRSYWSNTNRGNVNANGFTMITLTMAGGSGTSIMHYTKAKGYWNGVDIGATWNQTTSNGDPLLTTTDPRGMSFLGLAYGGSSSTTYGSGDGTLNQSSGIFPGNGSGTILGEVSIWNKVLSSAEVTALWNGGSGGSISKTTQPTDLISYWDFGSSSEGVDAGNAYVAPVWPDPSTNGNLGKAYIDGTSSTVSGGTNIIS